MFRSAARGRNLRGWQSVQGWRDLVQAQWPCGSPGCGSWAIPRQVSLFGKRRGIYLTVLCIRIISYWPVYWLWALTNFVLVVYDRLCCKRRTGQRRGYIWTCSVRGSCVCNPVHKGTEREQHADRPTSYTQHACLTISLHLAQHLTHHIITEPDLSFFFETSRNKHHYSSAFVVMVFFSDWCFKKNHCPLRKVGRAKLVAQNWQIKEMSTYYFQVNWTTSQHFQSNSTAFSQFFLS